MQKAEAVQFDLNTSAHARKQFIRSHLSFSVIFAVALITCLFCFSLYWNITNLKQEKVNLAIFQAESFWNKDAAFRQWATQHGGVYVKPSSKTPPNPNLAHLPNRDIVTTDGTQLTLMNPAYIMSQMVRDFDELYGVKGNITGKVQLNPQNKPDEWEFNSLTQFEQGVKRVTEITDIDGQPFLRFMKPMFMTKGCVHCHGILGFKDGDLRGGVSVSIPLNPFYAAAAETSRTIWYTHIIVWLLAMSAVYLFFRLAHAKQKERFQLLKQLEHDAVHDSLTQLPNRLLFTDRLNHAVERSSRDSEYLFAVCFLDLDRFKNLNDSYGHLAGDGVLVQLAERFNRAIRPADSVARIGGDEFTFLLDGLNNFNEALFIAERILGSLKSAVHTDFGEIYLNASIGVCLNNNTYTNSEDMLRDADIALYRAKESGRGRVDVFNQEMHEKAKQVMQMENDLRSAMEKQQMNVYFQPVINISENRIEGFEALLRWQHPQFGFISPDDFIPVAEDTGLINEIGRWVMHKACTTVRDWNLEFSPNQGMTVAVNLSGKQLVQTDLVENIQDILSTARFSAELLHCEVTETQVIQHRLKSAKVINDLQQMGVRISIDDFGKGYSSLTYLQEFNFNILKIDKDFVQDMEHAGKGLQLVKTMMMLARDFELGVIAEGVEDLDQLNRLNALGCKFIQGYYFSRPLSADDMYGLLRRGCHKDAGKLLEKFDNTTGEESKRFNNEL